MRDINILQRELVLCENELASLTILDHFEDDNKMNNYIYYIDPSRAEFLQGKINSLQSQIKIQGIDNN